MKLRTISSVCAAIALVVGSLLTIPAYAQGGASKTAATATSVKMGYFNLALVKASFPEAAGSDQLRQNAESMLRQKVVDGNSALQKAQKDGKPKQELDQMAKDIQLEVNSAQQALAQLVQLQAASATQAIAIAVNRVARDKSLDVVVDGAGVFAGGDKIVNNGVDVTQDIIKLLQPAAATASSNASQTK
jgi:Skp family chaperone for outer membrane proteins